MRGEKNTFLFVDERSICAEDIKDCLQIFIKTFLIFNTKKRKQRMNRNSNTNAESCKYSINEEKDALEKHVEEANEKKNVVWLLT